MAGNQSAPPPPPFICQFFSPTEAEWKPFKLIWHDGSEQDPTDEKTAGRYKAHREELRETLLQSLQMPNIVVLAGSGTSLGQVRGPSMWDLWDHIVHSNPGDGTDPVVCPKAASVIALTGYETATDGENIEALLSRCEAWLQLNSADGAEQVRTFVNNAKNTILRMCTDFLSDQNLEAHRKFLHRLSRRRNSDPRIKLFTTNYDLCFEKSAALQGLIVIDGFSLNKPRIFDPGFFGFDVVRRGSDPSQKNDFVEGVVHVLKLHGSVNWERQENGEIAEIESPSPEKACLIYPAHGKYQQSYVQPHLELMSQFMSSLRQTNTCLIVAGFGFNDDHLSAPILSAIQSNPDLRVVIADPGVMKYDQSENPNLRSLAKHASTGSDVWLLNTTFDVFSGLLPHLKSLTPAQQLEKAISRVRGGV
ncbi:SIR2 family protein [Marinobacter sp. B9-2]|nr:SIR2 family protein [Marinobacter sp. B9-2]